MNKARERGIFRWGIVGYGLQIGGGEGWYDKSEYGHFVSYCFWRLEVEALIVYVFGFLLYCQCLFYIKAVSILHQ